MLGYDFTPEEVKRVLKSAPDDLEAERRLLELYADVRTLNRPHADGLDDEDELGSPQEHLHAFLRSLDAEAEGLPDRYLVHLTRALAHYGVEGLDRTGALEDAAYRLFLSQQRAGTAREALRAVLARHLERGDHLQGEEGDAVRAVLDRLESALAPREPALAELTREVRWRCCDAPGLAAGRETRPTPRWPTTWPRWPTGWGDRDGHMGALVECPLPLAALLRRLPGDAGPLIEAMTRRYYRIRKLESVEQRLIDGIPFVLSQYVRDGVRHHVAASVAQPDDLPDVLRALASHAREVPEGEPRARRHLRAAAAEDADLAEPLPRRGAAGVGRAASRSCSRRRSTCARSTRDGEESSRPPRHAPDARRAHGHLAAARVRARADAVGRGHLPLPRRSAREPEGRAAGRARRGARPHAGARRARAHHRAARARADRPPGVRGDALVPVAAARRASACTGTGCCSTPGRRSTSRPPRRARSSTASRA